MYLEVLSCLPVSTPRPTCLLFVYGAWCWANFLDYFAAQGQAAYALNLRGDSASEGRGGLRWAGSEPVARQVRLSFTLALGLRYLLGNTVGETIPSLLDRERRERIFENVSNFDPESIKSDSGNVAYYQEIVFELLRQLGAGFTLQLMRRTLGYLVRLRSIKKGKESLNAKG